MLIVLFALMELSSIAGVSSSAGVDAIFIDATQESAAEAAGRQPQKRPTLAEAVPVASLSIMNQITAEEMGTMPAYKRGCLEEKIIDVTVQAMMNANITWQVLLSAGCAQSGYGPVWADMTDDWALECELVFDAVQEWTDAMWAKIGGQHFAYPHHVVEFHREGATQINLRTNSRRTVIRIEFMLGVGESQVMHDPYNVHNMVGSRQSSRC